MPLENIEFGWLVGWLFGRCNFASNFFQCFCENKLKIIKKDVLDCTIQQQFLVSLLKFTTKFLPSNIKPVKS